MQLCKPDTLGRHQLGGAAHAGRVFDEVDVERCACEYRGGEDCDEGCCCEHVSAPVKVLAPVGWERCSGFGCVWLFLLPRFRCWPRWSSNFSSLYHAANFNQITPNRYRPLLQDRWDVTPLPDYGHNGNESRRKRLEHEVVLTNRIEKKRSTTGELMPVAEGSMVFCNVLRAVVQIREVAVRQLLAPPGTRPGSRFA